MPSQPGRLYQGEEKQWKVGGGGGGKSGMLYVEHNVYNYSLAHEGGQRVLLL